MYQPIHSAVVYFVVLFYLVPEQKARRIMVKRVYARRANTILNDINHRANVRFIPFYFAGSAADKMIFYWVQRRYEAEKKRRNEINGLCDCAMKDECVKR